MLQRRAVWCQHSHTTSWNLEQGGGTVDQFMNNLVASVCYLVQVSAVSVTISRLPSHWQPFLGWRVLLSTWPGYGLYRAPIAMTPPWISPCQSSRWEKEREWWKQLIEIGVGGNTLHNLQESWPAETQNRSWDVLSAHSIPQPEPCLPRTMPWYTGTYWFHTLRLNHPHLSLVKVWERGYMSNMQHNIMIYYKYFLEQFTLCTVCTLWMHTLTT